MHNTPPIRTEIRGPRATITLDRPTLRNAFNDDCIIALTNAFDQLGRRKDLRCIVLAATGSAFCAGADLNWMQRAANNSLEENFVDAGAMARLFRTVHESPIPTIARIQGDAIAGGVGLVAACDVAVCADSAQFCLSEVRIGLIPATIGPYVIRALGARASGRYFVTGERFGAAEALRIGLVHQTVAAADLDAAVDLVAGSLCRAGPHAARCAKQFVREFAGRTLDDELVAETSQLIARLRPSPEGQQGLQAFLSKSSPPWHLEATETPPP